jgi:ribosome recycling factor
MMEFMGYIRPDGKVGARNFVAVIPSVTCANDVALAICRQVQGTVTYLHHQGCCQLPPDLERVTDTLISIGCSPNTASVLIVSLGCEGTDHERMVKEISATGKRVEIIHIQDLGGVSKAIMASDVGITPIDDGSTIRLNFPAPTEERRKQLAKEVAKLGEEAKVAVRNVRRDAMDKAKAMKKAGELTEDTQKTMEEEVQKLTDKYIKNIDAAVEEKQKEIMSV